MARDPNAADDRGATDEGELRFRLMADSIPQLVWIIDSAGKVEFFNRQWHDYTGALARSRSAHHIVADFVHPDDRDATLARWVQAERSGQSYIVEHRLRSASGEYRWFLVRAEPQRDPASGAVLRWFGTSTDVHDRRMAEAALRRSEERYRSLFDSIDEGFCILRVIFDSDGRACDYEFVETNPAFTTQTGLVDAVGKRMRDLAPAHEEHWFEMYGRIALTGEPMRFQQRAAALNRWYDVYAFRIDDPADRMVAVVFSDITARRRAEDERRAADRRKDEFLAMLAHELRNPLAPIGAAADLLRLGSLDPERVRHTSGIIARQVRHMTSLVDDLLDVSRVTRGLISLDLATLDANRIAADAVEQVRPLLAARGHAFSMALPPQAVNVLGDHKRLVQVLANLLNNAAKYTPEKGRIALALEVEGAQACIRISDNGIGMEAELVTHVFELFSQGERTSDRSQGGLGIGLALVRNLVGLHAGTVAADSDGPGRGSTFTVRLPLVDQPGGRPGSRRSAPAAAVRAGLAVLVVDDNPDAADMLAMFLQHLGYEVAVENNPYAALKRARALRPAACLLDIGLPGMDGYELARRLRACPETAGGTLFAITGYGQELDRAAAFAAGFDEYLVKPVDTQSLAAVLARRLQQAAEGG